VTEAELIRKIAEGSEEGFSELVKSCQQNVFRVCIGFVHNREDAEDLAQEVFIEAYKSIKHFRGEAKISTWLYRIAVNKSLNFLKKKKTSAILERMELLFAIGIRKELEDGQHPQKLMENKEISLVLKKAIESLPENQCTAFVLAKYESASYLQIAEIMNTSISAVESLLYRAKMNLQKKLVNHYKK
jgi:RNA polymerase sigma-70 factor (ECF subfamily)